MKRSSIALVILCILGLCSARNPYVDFYLPGGMTFNEFKSYTQQNPALNVTSFFPIGWSKDGRFALITSTLQADAGFYDVLFVILNTKIDKADRFLNREISADAKNPVRDFWKKNESKIKKLLASSNICQEEISLKQFPIVRQKDKVEALIEEKCSDEVIFGLMRSNDTRVILRSTSSEKKEVSQIDFHIVTTNGSNGGLTEGMSLHQAFYMAYNISRVPFLAG